MSVSEGWEELTIQGVQVRAKVEANGCLSLRREDMAVSSSKVARYNDRVASLQHELSHRLADVAGMHAEADQLFIQLGFSQDDHDLLEDIRFRAKARCMHIDRIQEIQQLTKHNV